MPGFVPSQRLAALENAARAQLSARRAPVELEADLKYPGAPESRRDAGGETIRRLLDAYGRGVLFAEEATSPILRRWLGAYFGEPVRMSRAHHNCIMTKHPRYGSETRWHRDVRYWSFAREELISVWVALGRECRGNGALQFIPRSHRMSFGADQFDSGSFFRSDHPQNIELIDTAESPQLAAGDAVFFHCSTLHSAGTNRSDVVKLSLVYTYHGSSNMPTSGTRSDSRPEVLLD